MLGSCKMPANLTKACCFLRAGFSDLLRKAFMNRNRVMHQELSCQAVRRRRLVVAVWAALPMLTQAQPLTVDPRLLGKPAVPAAAASAPAPVAAKPVAQPAPAALSRKPAAPVAPALPKPKADPRETRIEAGKVEGRDQVNLTAQDNVRLERGNMQLTSDHLYYDQVANEVSAKGNVKLLRNGDQIEGPQARVNLDTMFGEFDSPEYVLQRERQIRSGNVADARTGKDGKPLTRLVKGTGKAELLQLEGENQYRMTNATYTTCPAPDPSWYLRMRDLELDFDRDQGEATHSTLVFQNVPIAYAPWVNFPLSGGRQSGLLPPTVGATTSTGFDTTLPYYFNLAPNYDATLAPRWMSDRGLQLGGEGRYLMAKSFGSLRGEYLAEDKLEQTSRSLMSWRHNQDFGYGLSGTVDATQVSDRAYFADLSSKIGTTSQSTLAQQMTLGYSSGSWLSGNVLVQRYQVLSGASPYNRQPQISLNAKQADLYGLSLNLPVEYTSFSHSTPLPGTAQTQPDGRRTVLYPQIAYPVQSAAAYVTPKIGIHSTRYNLDQATSSGDSRFQRNVPIMSLDSGLVFERETISGGVDQIQTLEPRLYYAKAGYRDQSQIPVFDTAKADFNFAQIFSENTYSGSDRIADSNQLTAGVQSRMLEASSGEEWLRAALAQRYYFADQRVTLPGETQRAGRVANVLGGLSGRFHHDWWAETVLQYDPRVGLWQRGVAGLRYQPDFSKTASLSYRYQRDQFRNIDISAQWPLWGNWYGVGRYDLNLRDHRASETIAGLEYKGDCWVLRGVWQTLVTTNNRRNNSIFVQLEFSGLASIGSSPVSLLKRSVSGYGKINEPGVGDPMFGDSSQP